MRQFAYTATGLASCELARVEFHAVVQRHLREGALLPNEADEVLADFASDEASGVWQWLPVTSFLLSLTCARVRAIPTDTFLRTVDAIHLTCAQMHDYKEIYSNDRHLLAAAPHFGLRAINLI